MTKVIRCNQPFLHENEVDASYYALRSGCLAMGPYTEVFQDNVKALVNREYGLGFSSATSAFDAYFEYILSPGDEVIISPFTFHSVIYSILRAGGVPVFIDIKNDFLADWSFIDNLISDRTKVIVITHIFGKPDYGLFDILKYQENGIKIIEDAAQSIGARYYGQYVGDSGSDAVIYSFYATKNITAAEGGIIAFDDDSLFYALKNLRNNGIVVRKDGSRIFGTNRRLSDIHSALGIENLTRIDDITYMRNYQAAIYNTLLGLDEPEHPPGTIHSRHHFTLLVNKEDRYRIYNECKKNDIDLGLYYTYLSNHDINVKDLCKNTDTPVCNLLTQMLLQLPLGELISYYDQEKVVESIMEIYDGPIYAT